MWNLNKTLYMGSLKRKWVNFENHDFKKNLPKIADLSKFQYVMQIGFLIYLKILLSMRGYVSKLKRFFTPNYILLHHYLKNDKKKFDPWFSVDFHIHGNLCDFLIKICGSIWKLVHIVRCIEFHVFSSKHTWYYVDRST